MLHYRSSVLALSGAPAGSARGARTADLYFSLVPCNEVYQRGDRLTPCYRAAPRRADAPNFDDGYPVSASAAAGGAGMESVVEICRLEIIMIGKQVWVNLLGTLEVSHTVGVTAATFPLGITAAKLRQVLAMLAVNTNTMVSTEQLIDELWPYGPPSTVKTIVQTYVYQLRKLFCSSFKSSQGTALLITRPGGYVLAVPRENVDIFQFQHLMECGRNALRRGQAACAADLLRESLNLWRGPMFADINSGPCLHGLSVYLGEQRLEAVSLRIEADLANNRHREIVGELRSLVATHRLHEAFHIRLMQALHRSGRRGDALNVYRQLRRILDDELGLEPSPEAKRIQQEILVSQ